MIWHRSEMASTRQPSFSRRRMRKLRIGTSVSGSATAEMTSRSRSGTGPHLHARRCAQVGEKRVDPFPHLLPSAEPAPADANEPDELETAVDGSDEVIAGTADTIDQQRLHIRFQGLEEVIVRNQLAPAFERQHRFGGARRAGIE